MRGEQSVCPTYEAGLITLDALLDMGHKHPSISQTFCHQCLKRCDAKKLHMKVMKSSKTKTVSWSESDHDISLLTPGYASWHLCLKVNYTSNCCMATSICMKEWRIIVCVLQTTDMISTRCILHWHWSLSFISQMFWYFSIVNILLEVILRHFWAPCLKSSWTEEIKWHISNETWKSGYKLIKIVRIDGKVPAAATATLTGQKKQALILREKTLIWKNAEEVLILPWIRSWPCAQRGQSASGIIAADERHGWWWFVFFLMFLFLHFYYLRVVHGSLYSILGVFLLTLLLCYFWLKPQECEN